MYSNHLVGNNPQDQGNQHTSRLMMPELSLAPTSPSSASMPSSDLFKFLVQPSLPTIMENSSNNINASSAIMVPTLAESSGLKRKRDWMSSLSTQPQLNSSLSPKIKSNSSSPLLTSVKVNGSSLPAGWEQYLDLQSGETYYVNWNTRTKHCRVHCPEVQRCLGKLVDNKKNKDTVESMVRASLKESWLSKMTAATTALINNNTTRPPLMISAHKAHHQQLEPLSAAVINRGKRPGSRHPNLDLNLACSGKQNLVKGTLVNDNYASNNANASSVCSYGMESPSLVSKVSENIASKVAKVSTILGPATAVCKNCNMFVMVSSPPPAHCANCSHVLDTWPDDLAHGPPDTSAAPLQLFVENSSDTTKA